MAGRVTMISVPSNGEEGIEIDAIFNLKDPYMR